MNDLSRFPLQPDSLLYIYYLQGRGPDAVTGQAQHSFLGTWYEDGFSFLFFLAPQPVLISELTSKIPGLMLLDEYVMRYADWQGGAVETLAIGRFLFRPPWQDKVNDPARTELFLDPGVVFGNGSHPTTSTCLTVMEELLATGDVTTVQDLGTGTGILALAAASMGCARILAVDFNFLAARTAYANVCHNSFQDTILVVQGRAEELLGSPADLLIANIHYQVMRNIVASPSFLAHKWFLLSGLLASEATRIREHLTTLPVEVRQHLCDDGIWHTILGVVTG